MKLLKRAALLLCLAVTVCTVCACAAGDKKWKGDTMKDFKAEGLQVSDTGAGLYERTPYEERLVGLAYTTWHQTPNWTNSWTEPAIGTYKSDDPEVLAAHGKMLGEAGVDFVFADWSNNITFQECFDERVTFENVMNGEEPGITGRSDFAVIERAVVKMFEVWCGMEEKTPQIAIMLGCPDKITALIDGSMQTKADQVYNWFLANEDNPQFADKYMMLYGKPLLMVYLGTPTFVNDRDPLTVWNDERFTVRYVTGFTTEQSLITNMETLESKYGFWSWEDRRAQTFAVNRETNMPEAMTVVASYRKQSEPGEEDYIPSSGRRDGLTFREQWARARLIGVKIALVVSWNEYSLGEQIDEETSKDLEPNAVYGDQYYELLKSEISRFKSGK